ncbi:DNA polymerase [Candidatus Woesearchaeota archaeon B3_Woes]|nr:MAG: DNA polymerase [Candidatus Woesearchaeota archaeon B3_Woes]
MAEKIPFFVLDAKYKVVNDKLEVYLFGRTTEGKPLIILDDSFEPYFYVIPKKGQSLNSKIEKLRIEQKDDVHEVIRTENVKKNYLGKDVDAIKVFVRFPKDVPVIRDIIKDWEIIESINEYDIHFIRRYLIDKGITPMMLYEIEGESVNRKAKVPVYKIESIKQVGDETLTSPRILAFDIETYNPDGKSINFEKNPIIMISFYGNHFRKVITWKRFKTKEKYIEFVDSEADLIQKFKEILETYVPDIIAGYFSDGFDLPYIQKRAEKYKIKLDIGLDSSDLNVSKRKVSKAKISGIVHLDVLNVIKKMFSLSLKTDYYDLSSVSEELIGEKKTDADLDELSSVWDNKPDDLEKYCEYNLQDSRLAYKLAEKIMPNIIEMVKIVGLPMYEITRMGFSQLVEWYLIKQAFNFKEICPNKPHYGDIKDRMLNRYKGAFVFEPTPGLYKDIIIFDFRSLYPTIISSHNISPGMLNCGCCREKAEKAPLEKDEYWFCTQKKGFLPTVIEDLIKRRRRIKDMMKRSKNVLLDARQTNLKVLANAFYGYFGFFNARWYSLECARSITAWGRYYIHKVIESAEKEGFKVIYSDTDSIFLSLDGKSKTEAKQFAESINPTLPGIMELEYEGFYPAAIFVSAKAGAYGAKKKYALLDSDNNIKITGFETVRRNWSLIAKETQKKILNIVLKENNPDKALRYVKTVVQDLRERKIDLDKVIIRTQLTKDIDSYAAVGPHVVVAKKLKSKGHDIAPGMIIEFVVTEGKGSIGDRAKVPEEIKDNKYDSEYYINNQVVPAVDRILEVLGYTKEDLLSNKKQSKLGAFMK